MIRIPLIRAWMTFLNFPSLCFSDYFSEISNDDRECYQQDSSTLDREKKWHQCIIAPLSFIQPLRCFDSYFQSEAFSSHISNLWVKICLLFWTVGQQYPVQRRSDTKVPLIFCGSCWSTCQYSDLSDSQSVWTKFFFCLRYGKPVELTVKGEKFK